MSEVSEILRAIAIAAFAWNLTAAMWKHWRGGDWHYHAFLALMFQTAATIGAAP